MLDLVHARVQSARNCLSCSNYIRCKDPQKSVVYLCDRFATTRKSEVEGSLRLADLLGEIGLGYSVPIIGNDPHSHMPAPDAHASGEFDIKKVIDDIILNDEPVSSDIKISDRDFPQAPNFYTFCVSDKYLNQTPFLEQAIIGTRVLAEYCPACSDMNWFDHSHKVDDSLHKFARKVALMEKGTCPHCKKTRTHFFAKGTLNFYNEAALAVGQRGGKSAWFGMMAAYLTHLQIKLQKPNEVYGLLRANILHGTFAALTFSQAKDTLWEPFYGHLLDSPWFRGYHAMLDDATERYGEELYKLKDTFVMYRHRRLLVYPAGPDKRTLRGRTRFMAGIDELGWFPNDANNSKVKMNATEVYIALERSLLTVRASAENLAKQGFSNIPTAYFLNISSPSSIRDKIMELVRKAQGSRKIYGTIKPTWEMNPKVPRSALEEEFRKDPVAAMRDYGAEPPLTASPFIGSQSAVEDCFSEKLNRIRIIHQQKKSTDGTISRYARIDRVTRLSKPSVLAIDAGYSNNSFACCIASLEEHKYPRISLLVEVMPLPGIPLNYSRIYSEILVPLCDECNVVLVGADRWNSLKILSDLNEELDIQTVQHSIKYPEMQLFKSYIYDNQILFPLPRTPVEDILKYDQSTYPHCFKDRPEDHFVLQLLTVQDTGASVTKGDQLTDDLVRASMLATTLLLDPEYEELFSVSDREAPAAQSALGMYKGGSGGSSHGSRSAAGGPPKIGVVRSYG